MDRTAPIGVRMRADARINSRQRAASFATPVGPDENGNEVFELVSKGWNRYREKGNTYRIWTKFLDERDEVLAIHLELVGVSERGVFDKHRSNKHNDRIVLPQNVGLQVADIDCVADNDGNTDRLRKEVEEIVKEGMKKGLKDLIAKGIVKAGTTVF